MSRDELRAAAELVVATGMNKDWAGSIDAGAVEVCRDWLRANSADDQTPVTAAWLRSVGMADYWFQSMLGPERHTGFQVQFGVDYVNHSVCLHAGMSTIATPIKAPTRGHVRRLAAALGITLTEQPQ